MRRISTPTSNSRPRASSPARTTPSLGASSTARQSSATSQASGARLWNLNLPRYDTYAKPYYPITVTLFPIPPPRLLSSRLVSSRASPHHTTPLTHSHCVMYNIDGGEAHAHVIRRAEERPRRRAQMGRARGRTRTIREPRVMARSDARHPRQGHGRRDGGQDGRRECAAGAPRDGRQAQDALF